MPKCSSTAMCARVNRLANAGCLAALAAWSIVCLASPAQAGGWANPLNLSSTARDSLFPSIVVDQFGGSHVVWCEAEPNSSCDEILYSHFDGQSWSQPVDIVAAATGQIAHSPALAIDSLGVLHLVWVGGFTNRVMYSRAPGQSAATARAWSQPISVGGIAALTELPDVAVDRDDAIHVVFAVRHGEGSGIFHVMSSDGSNWTAPIPVYANDAGDRTVWQPRLAIDSGNGLHVVWSSAGYPETYPSSALDYARSLDSGVTWAYHTSFNGPYSLAGILAKGDDEIHIVWSGTASDRHKFHSWSRDRGSTWSAPSQTNPNGGLEGWSSLGVDSVGDIHLLQVAGAVLTHQTWTRGNYWSAPEQLLAMLPGAPNHPTNPDLAVGLGNQLHAVVSHYVKATDSATGWQFDIYYTHCTLENAPAIAARPSPTRLGPQSTAIAVTTTSSGTALSTRAASSVPSTSSTPTPEPRKNPSETNRGVALGALQVGILCAALVTVVVAALHLVRRKGHRLRW